jgi:hypothetical protein
MGPTGVVVFLKKLWMHFSGESYNNVEGRLGGDSDLGPILWSSISAIKFTDKVFGRELWIQYCSRKNIDLTITDKIISRFCMGEPKTVYLQTRNLTLLSLVRKFRPKLFHKIGSRPRVAWSTRGSWAATSTVWAPPPTSRCGPRGSSGPSTRRSTSTRCKSGQLCSPIEMCSPRSYNKTPYRNRQRVT